MASALLRVPRHDLAGKVVAPTYKLLTQFQLLARVGQGGALRAIPKTPHREVGRFATVPKAFEERVAQHDAVLFLA